MTSNLIPERFQNNLGNVLIALNMAKRLGADPLMTMQNLYVVHGNPGWSAVFLIATFNQNGKFSAIKYKFDGEGDDYGCTAYATELKTGDVIEGSKVTWAIVKGEGWSSKSGSKWKTMPDQMFRYRAATFFIRSTAPEIAMGLQTKDELEDMGPDIQAPQSTQAAGVAGLSARLGIPPESESAPIDAEFVESGVVHADAQIMEPHAGPEGESEAAAGIDDENLDLRNHVRGLLESLDKKDQKNVMAGRKLVKDMDRDELKSLEKAIEEFE
jgi:hypothetical protein